MEKANSVGYSFGMVEGYLDKEVSQGFSGATEALEHFHAIETAYKDLLVRVTEQDIKLQEISLNLSGWKKI